MLVFKTNNVKSNNLQIKVNSSLKKIEVQHSMCWIKLQSPRWLALFALVYGGRKWHLFVNSDIANNRISDIAI